MADKKISELIDNTNPSGDNIIPIVASVLQWNNLVV
jgi:hypothetical protein